MSADASAIGGCFVLLRQEGERAGKNRIYRLYREEGLTVRKHRARRGAVAEHGAHSGRGAAECALVTRLHA